MKLSVPPKLSRSRAPKAAAPAAGARGTRKAPRPVVGLDIEPGRIAAVEVRVADGLEVARAATAPLDPGVVRDGEVADVEALAEALRGLWAKHKLAKRVRLGLANQRIVVRTVDLPPVQSPKELDAAVRFSAQDHIPMPLDQAVLEHQSLGIVETPEGPRARVVLVAARRDMVERLVAAVSAAGLRPEGVDLSAFAMIRALGARDAGAVLYLSIGGVTNLALAEHDRCLFTRVIPGGSEYIAQQLAERRGLTLDHAHGWLRHVGLEDEVADVEGEGEIVAEARAVLSDGVRRVGEEVRNSLDFFRMQEASVDVQRVVLTGPAAAIPGFAASLGAEIGVEVASGAVAVAPNAAGGDADDDAAASGLAVAAGLAVTELVA